MRFDQARANPADRMKPSMAPATNHSVMSESTVSYPIDEPIEA